MGISLRKGALGAVIALLAAGFGPAADARAAETKTIHTVEVQASDGGSRIVLTGAEDAIYTAFMREDPPRLIVELPEVAFENVATPIEVGDGIVRSVALGAFGEPGGAQSMARVSIALERASEYEVVPQGDRIAIEIRPLEPVAATETVPAAIDKSSDETPAAMSEVDEPEFDTARAPTEPQDATSPATQPEPEAPAAPDEAVAAVEPGRILDVKGEGRVVRVIADSPIDNFDAFQLSNPDRLVIDFFGVRSGVPRATLAISGSTAVRARVGEHADKVRVVLDLAQAVDSHLVDPEQNGVRIVLGAPVASAGEPSDEPPAAPAPEEAQSTEAPSEDVPETSMADEAESDDRMSEDEATDGDLEEANADEAADEEPLDMAESREPEATLDSEEAISSDDETDADADTGSSDMAADDEVLASSDDDDHIIEIGADEDTPVHDGVVEVESVHFESLPGVDRVVISLDNRPESKIVTPDSTTLMVLLSDARISEENERRVDTREFRGAIDMFSIFTTPDVSYDEVRLVMRRNQPVTPTLRWSDGQLYVEVPRKEAPASSDPMPSMPGATTSVQPGASPGAVTPSAPGMARAPAGPAPTRTIGGTDPLEGDPFLEGPADPAAIDILEEGGFDEEKSYQGRRISLDFKDADIGNILRLIAEVSDLNVIAGEEVGGKVTIRLVDVPWDQALDVILLTKGLGFVRIGNILRIAPIDTLKMEREARLQERRAREKLEDLVVKLQPVNFARAKAVAKLVKRLLSARGSVNVDQRTNTLIIKDIPSVIHEATALVKALDTQTPQVMIEAKIVEASLNFSRGLGTVWGTQYLLNGTRGGAGDLRLGDTNPILSSIPNAAGALQQTNFVSSNGIAAPTGFLTLGLLALDDHVQLDLQIQASETSGKAKVISSPRVVTLDNKRAVIKQGVAIKFEEATQDKITVSFIDAVLQLQVTPHITANKSIIMKIKVSRNAPSLSGDSVVGIDKNETSTEAIVRDGQTMVLGGIYVVDNGHSRSKVPFLADIPLLGAAFRSIQLQDERRELLIFVTPTVVQDPQSEL